MNANTSSAAVLAAFDISQAYAEHGSFITRVLRRLTGLGPHVEDLLQETFITAFKRQHTFAGRSSVRTWLYGIARHMAMRHNRGRQRWFSFQGRLTREPTVGSADPSRLLERYQDSAAVQRALETLSLKQREVIILFELEELSGDEIAEMLQVKRNAVWQRLHDARRNFTTALRRELQKAEEEKRP